KLDRDAPSPFLPRHPLRLEAAQRLGGCFRRVAIGAALQRFLEAMDRALGHVAMMAPGILISADDFDIVVHGAARGSIDHNAVHGGSAPSNGAAPQMMRPAGCAIGAPGIAARFAISVRWLPSARSHSTVRPRPWVR